METIASDLISLLRYLLPGFLSAWVFYGFTSFQKPTQFERVVQALIFTLLVQTIVFSIQGILQFIERYGAVYYWSEALELSISVFVAAITGFTFAYFANTDKFHALFRYFGITRETSYPSEWFGEFSSRITFVVLHLSGERRIYGWPKEWPSSPDKGHFSLNEASWLTDDGEIPLTGVEAILIPVKNVEMVEFMRKTWES